MSTSAVTLTREQLYEMVWKEPIRTVAARYGLSDRGLAKACVRLHVPVPGRGFWQQKAAGKRPSRPCLPALPTAPPQERQITLGGEWSRGTSLLPTSAAGRQTVLEKAPDRAIQVPQELVDPHPLVARTAKALRRAKADSRKVLVAEAKDVLDVRVTRSSLDRALRIIDALLKALAARGFETICVEKDEQRTRVNVLDEEISFFLEEGISEEKRVEKRRVTRDLFPHVVNPLATYDHVVHHYAATGELALRISNTDFLGVRRSWRDGRRQRLENLLNRFIVGLVAVAEARKAERQRREELERQWEERRRAEAERARLREEEERRVRRLKEDLAAWQTSLVIREYVAAMGAETGARDESDEQRRELDEWLQWVAAYAERLDPATRAMPPRDA